MRPFQYIIGAVAAMALMASCNDEVFVVELTPSRSAVDFSEEGGSVSIGFNTGDWDVRMLFMSGAGSDSYFIVDGGKEFNIWPPSLEGNGTLVIKDGGAVAATISRSSARSLDVAMTENLSVSGRTLSLLVANDLFQKQISVSQKSCKWTLEDISWNESSVSDETVIVPKSSPLTVNNTGEDDVVLKVKVFDECLRGIRFDEEPVSGSPDFPDPGAEVAVPEGIDSDGGLVFSAGRVPYRGTLLESSDGIPDVETEVVFRPGRHTYELLIEYRQLTVGYTASYETAGGKHSIRKNGTFTSRMPTGKWYGIWKE